MAPRISPQYGKPHFVSRVAMFFHQASLPPWASAPFLRAVDSQWMSPLSPVALTGYELQKTARSGPRREQKYLPHPGRILLKSVASCPALRS